MDYNILNKMKTPEELLSELNKVPGYAIGKEDAAATLKRIEQMKLTLIKNAKTEWSGEWIDVKIKLPQKGQRVLCVQDPHTTATREALFGIFDGKRFTPPQQNIYADYEVGQSRWADIIYWMPLPETPEPEQPKL